MHKKETNSLDEISPTKIAIKNDAATFVNQQSQEDGFNSGKEEAIDPNAATSNSTMIASSSTMDSGEKIIHTVFLPSSPEDMTQSTEMQAAVSDALELLSNDDEFKVEDGKHIFKDHDYVSSEETLKEEKKDLMEIENALIKVENISDTVNSLTQECPKIKFKSVQDSVGHEEISEKDAKIFTEKGASKVIVADDTSSSIENSEHEGSPDGRKQDENTDSVLEPIHNYSKLHLNPVVVLEKLASVRKQLHFTSSSDNVTLNANDFKIMEEDKHSETRESDFSEEEFHLNLTSSSNSLSSPDFTAERDSKNSGKQAAYGKKKRTTRGPGLRKRPKCRKLDSESSSVSSNDSKKTKQAFFSSKVLKSWCSSKSKTEDLMLSNEASIVEYKSSSNDELSMQLDVNKSVKRSPKKKASTKKMPETSPVVGEINSTAHQEMDRRPKKSRLDRKSKRLEPSVTITESETIGNSSSSNDELSVKLDVNKSVRSTPKRKTTTKISPEMSPVISEIKGTARQEREEVKLNIKRKRPFREDLSLRKVETRSNMSFSLLSAGENDNASPNFVKKRRIEDSGNKSYFQSKSMKKPVKYNFTFVTVEIVLEDIMKKKTALKNDLDYEKLYDCPKLLLAPKVVLRDLKELRDSNSTPKRKRSPKSFSENERPGSTSTRKTTRMSAARFRK